MKKRGKGLWAMRDADIEDIENRFRFHPATDAEKRNAHDSARAAFLAFALDLNERLPKGRERSLAVTKLEEAMFWSNAALAREGGSSL